ncbi:peptidylprolyl isomerase [Sphingomonas sp. LY54]|uniref:peptidylprolyl isomerase n=1 Tax=Sphingomonas sp. LY54 TaxID=3095343 RepID=UPI002D76B644|nr:peptidylprolyl isomerase [Sphingomonas sp. LY54]WRP29106.1 peptidylprolyl isomerase [Sphingomonas sp. LY54]
MFARFALLALALLPLVPAQAQEPAPAAAPQPAVIRVVLETAEGPIVLALEKERAPVTTANFLRYVDGKRLDGVAFYRATPIGQGYGLIQGGVRNDPKRVLPPIAHEPTTKTGLSHVDGAISMARAAPGSANADFFITVGDLVSMDADPKQPGDNQGFAVFGRVVEGMDLVRRILAAPTSPTAGEGAMKGQMLAPPIPIVRARRAD